jgi:hypothetical protein
MRQLARKRFKFLGVVLYQFHSEFKDRGAYLRVLASRRYLYVRLGIYGKIKMIKYFSLILLILPDGMLDSNPTFIFTDIGSKKN